MATLSYAALPGTSAVQGRATVPVRLCRSASTGRLTTWRSVVQLKTRSNSKIKCFSDGSSGRSTNTLIEERSSLYSLLGLDQTVEAAQIKAAYRKMALKYHPDVSSPEKRELNTKMFLQVQNAYDVLSDPASRKDYDLLLKQSVSGRGSQGWEQAVRYGAAGRRKERDFASSTAESWKGQWEAQLERLRSRERESMSWGSRMRCQHG